MKKIKDTIDNRIANGIAVIGLKESYMSYASPIMTNENRRNAMGGIAIMTIGDNAIISSVIKNPSKF